MANVVTKIFTDEKTYQNIFYQKILGDKFDLKVDRSTDGYIDGTIFEHKQNVTSYGRSKTLSQALIYLSRFNRDGIPVPKNIMLVSQDEKIIYLYDSGDYLSVIDNISKYANLSPSMGIPGFIEKKEPKKIPYDLDVLSSNIELFSILNKIPEYTKVNISKHNVYGWANYFYSHSKKPKKIHFFKELRNPTNELKNFILPWSGQESDFSLIMDLLNDPSQQKKLGAFYTPPAYAKKAVELVRKAIARVPDGNDYVIIDRCAGTGTLECELNEEELSHVIVNTYEVKEWHALKDRLGGLVRCILPPIPIKENEYPPYDSNGFLNGSNALDEKFLYREEIKKYIDNPTCTIILFENPPYADDAADTPTTGESRGNTKDCFIAKQMNNEVKSDFNGLVQSKDIANLFIWSAFKYYLRQNTDSYILFSPVKYFKTGHLVNRKFIDGYAFNRLHFHAGKSTISCILWSNEYDNIESFTLKAYDIANGEIVDINKNIEIKKIHKSVNEVLFDKRKFETDTKDGIWSRRDGTEGERMKSTATDNIYNENAIAYLHLVGFAFDSKNLGLTRNVLNLRKNGFILRKDNFLEKLPLFCAKSYPQDNWYETDVYSTTADKGDSYLQDKEFLKKCLIFTCFSTRNCCLSLIGSDGRLYLNELCFFDESTSASIQLKTLISQGCFLSREENELFDLYNLILKEIYCKEEYNNNFKYGIHQIDQEINISIIIGYEQDGTPKYGHKYGDLNNLLCEFKKKIGVYYRKNLIEPLLQYELLK